MGLPNCRELTVLSYARHSLYATKDEVSYIDGVELDSIGMEAYDAELVECLAEEASPRTEGKRSNASQSAALLSSS